MPQGHPRRPTPEQAAWLHSFLGVDISQYRDHAMEALSNAGHQVEQGLSDAEQAVEQKASDVGHAVLNGAGVVKDGVVHAAEEVGEVAMEAIHAAVKFMKEVGELGRAMLEECKALGALAIRHIGECPTQWEKLVATVAVGVASGVTFIGGLIASATPAAVLGIPVVVISGTAFVVNLINIYLSVEGIIQCEDDLIAKKKKDDEEKKNRQDDEAKVAQIQQREQQVEQREEKLEADFQRLLKQRTAVQELSKRLKSHEHHLRALLQAAPKHELAQPRHS